MTKPSLDATASRRPTIHSLAILGFSLVTAATLVHGRQVHRGNIRVDVNLVEILASVSDADGHPLANLPESAFSISEEGVPQKIVRFEPETNRPLDLALMVDSSMSAEKDLKFEEESAAHFISQVVRPGDSLALFQFSDSVIQLSEYTDHVPELESATRHISPGAGTAMYDALVLGSRSLAALPTGRRRAIVLVTDAGETTSTSRYEDAQRAAVSSGALLYSVIIRPVKNENGRNTAGEHALITITDYAGGDFFILDSLSQLQDIFDRINRELRTQYLIGYYPNPAPPPGSLRHISLQVAGGDTVRYRKEYFTPRAR
ncbi:MAG TPA: VWA domain-containing protein [Verrucomicrobiae bacterium]|nr:VWA domain-containing protein [Verrucomicrobiae bacterium]